MVIVSPHVTIAKFQYLTLEPFGRMTTTARLTAGFSAYAQPGHGGAYGGAYGGPTGRYGGPRARRRPPAAVDAGRAMSAQNAIAARAGRDAAFATVYRF